jgi:hypothetical protein
VHNPVEFSKTIRLLTGFESKEKKERSFKREGKKKLKTAMVQSEVLKGKLTGANI